MVDNRYITTDGHSFAYKEDAEEHQQYINRISFIDNLIAKVKSIL